jgi:hypothetical protein
MRRALPPGARAAWLAALALGLSACASLPQGAQPIQYLDRNTGATFMVAARPMIFAHVRPQTAARVRDYATVTAGYLDRSGRIDRIDYVLLVYLWSTVDPRYEPSPRGAPPDLVLVADDRRIPLRPFPDLGQAPPPVGRPPVRHYVAAIYRCDLATLRYLTIARYLSLQRGDGRQEVRFELWDDQRAPLRELVRSGQ